MLVFWTIAFFFWTTADMIAEANGSTTYYVSAKGNDMNDGLSENKPFKDLANAIYRMNLGDTLIVMPGDYELVDFHAWCRDPWKKKMFLGREGGDPDIRTTIKGRTDLPRPRIKALKADGTIGGLQFNGAVGITLEHLDIHGGVGYGQHMIYRGCFFGGRGTVYGVGSKHDDTIIENNLFHDIYDGGDAIGIYIHGDRNQIRNNFFTNIAHHGFQTYDANNLIIENNMFTQIKGHGIAFRDMNHSIIRNNVLVNVESQAVSFGGKSNKNIRFIGNTIYNGEKGYYGLFFINDVQNLVVENNLIVHPMPVAFLKPGIQLNPMNLRTYTFRNNLYFNPYQKGERVFFPTNNPKEYFGIKAWQKFTARLMNKEQGLEENSVYVSPKVIHPPKSGNDYLKFRDASGINVRLTKSSPAVDTGIDNQELSFDADGNSRPTGIQTDIGAYEFNPATLGK